MPNVQNRSIFMIGGYEPKTSDAFYTRTLRELERYCKTHDVSSKLMDKGDEDDGKVARLQLETDHSGHKVKTDWHFMVWNDIVLGDFAMPATYRIMRYVLTFLDYVLTGTFFKIAFTAWRFALYFLYPAVMVTLFAFVGWGAGGYIGSLLEALGLIGALIIGKICAILIFFTLWHFIGKRYYVAHLCDLWSFSRNYLRGYRVDGEARLDHFANRLVERVKSCQDDEIILVGHSTGGGLILEVAARALALDPKLAHYGPRIQILTVGSTGLKIGLHPKAHEFRMRVQSLIDEPKIYWTEWQALTDIINLYQSKPVEAMGLSQRARDPIPDVKILRIRHMVTPDMYKRMKTNFFRVHYQFIMGNTQRYEYDFYDVCCGPNLLNNKNREVEQ